ncbi:hypothetical protein NDU88_004020, partial [Pleurodeles waltl]
KKTEEHRRTQKNTEGDTKNEETGCRIPQQKMRKKRRGEKTGRRGVQKKNTDEER